MKQGSTKGGSRMPAYLAWCDASFRNEEEQVQIGYTIKEISGKMVHEESLLLQYDTMNSVYAEYCALLACVEKALELKLGKVFFHLDCVSVVNDVRYGKKKYHYEALRNHIRELFQQKGWETNNQITYLPRSQNKEAHQLCKLTTNERYEHPLINTVKQSKGKLKKKQRRKRMNPLDSQKVKLTFDGLSVYVTETVLRKFETTTIFKGEDAKNLLIHHLIMAKKTRDSQQTSYRFGNLMLKEMNGCIQTIEFLRKKRDKEKKLTQAEKERSNQLKERLNLMKKALAS